MSFFHFIKVKFESRKHCPQQQCFQKIGRVMTERVRTCRIFRIYVGPPARATQTREKHTQFRDECEIFQTPNDTRNAVV